MSLAHKCHALALLGLAVGSKVAAADGGQIALMQTQGAALESAVSMDKAEGLDPLVHGEQSGDSGTWCEAAGVRIVLYAFRHLRIVCAYVLERVLLTPRVRTG